MFKKEGFINLSMNDINQLRFNIFFPFAIGIAGCICGLYNASKYENIRNEAAILADEDNNGNTSREEWTKAFLSIGKRIDYDNIYKEDLERYINSKRIIE